MTAVSVIPETESGQPRAVETVEPDEFALSSFDDDRSGPMEALKNSNYVRFWSTFTISMTGAWVRITAMGVLVYDLTGDPFKLGLMSFAQAVPELIAGPIAGAYLDRVDRRKVIVATQLLALVATALLTVLVFAETVEFWHLLTIGALLGLVAGFDWPARLALVPSLVPRRELQSAIALNMAGFNGARIIGPTIAGWTIAGLGVAACFAFTTIAILPMLLIVMTLTVVRPRVAHAADAAKPLTMLKEGYRYIWRTPRIRGLLSVDIIPIALGMSYSTMAPAIAQDVLDLPDGGLGWLLGAVGVGSLIGTIAVALLAGARHRGKIVIAAVAAFGVMVAAFGISSHPWISFPVAFLIGMVWAIYSTMGDTLVQTNVDEDYRGRVVSVQSMLWGLTPIGGLLAGFLATLINVQWAVAINGILILGYVPYLWWWTPVRHLR
jgi:MFS family permease